MGKSDVVIFKPYPFADGQKIYIDGGPRKGDWEVVGIGDRKIKFRCPISFRDYASIGPALTAIGDPTRWIKRIWKKG